MNEIKISSFAKINLSIDVTAVLGDGMHQVDMVMQQLSFHDDVTVKFTPNKKKKAKEKEIQVSTNRYYLPTDERNLAYKAALLMIEKYGDKVPGGRIEIKVFKRIPVAAGLAGGSGNGAAVLHGLNALWKLDLGVGQLCQLGAELGSDVPFCVMGQASYNFVLPRKIRKDSLAKPCARATGTGTHLEPLKGMNKALVIVKPPISVSTKEVYQGIDKCHIKKRPDNEILTKALMESDYDIAFSHFVNVLEAYTLQAYPEVGALKERLEKCENVEKVLMSGSGPTVFGIFANIHHAKDACNGLRAKGYEAYWTKTTR